MYIIQNIETKEIELATSLAIVSELTQIPTNKMHHVFSRKKEEFFEYLQYKIHKKKPYVRKITRTKNGNILSTVQSD